MAAIYDAPRDRLLFFSGGDSARRPGVWAFGFSGPPGWTQVATTGTEPSPRNDYAAVYDLVRDRLLVIGGHDGGNRNDVWQLSLSGTPTWSQLFAAGTAPSGRSGHAAIYDPVGDRIILTGGTDGSTARYDVWSLALGGTLSWTQLSPMGSGPSSGSPLVYHVSIYDPLRRRMIAVAWGTGGGAATWALSLDEPPTWTLLVPPASGPPVRNGHVGVYDAARDRMIIFGGGGDSGVLNDTWSLDLSGTPTWTQLNVSGPLPVGRVDHTAIYDPGRSAMIVYGGSNLTPFNQSSFTVFDDTWRLSLAGTPGWSELWPVSSYDFTAGPGSDFVVVNDDHLWSVTGTASGLQIAKPADPAQLEPNGFIAGGIASRFTVDGDFAVTADYTDATLTPDPSAPHTLNEALLCVTALSPGPMPYFEVLRYASGADNGQYLEAFSSAGSPIGSIAAPATVLSSGRFRISRVAGTLTAAFAPLGSENFTALGSQGGFTGPMRVKLLGVQGTDAVASPRAHNAVGVTFGNLVVAGEVATPMFGPVVEYAVGNRPHHVATVDLDNDGKLDLVCANQEASSISVLHGRGDGSFSTRVDYPTSSTPIMVAVGDLNNDGSPDVAAPAYGASAVSVLLNRGDGTFFPANSVAVGSNPYSLALGDFNDDGALDLVVGWGTYVSVLPGQGDGTFGIRRDQFAGGGVSSVAVGDFNGDGAVDVAANNGYSTIGVFLGNGDGTLQSPTTYSTAPWTYTVIARDLNRDGVLDLAVAAIAGNAVSVLLGNGDGTFRPRTDYPAGVGAYSITAADLDGDGIVDLAVANSGDGTVTVLAGHGDGSLGSPVAYGTGNDPNAVAVGDFDRDGRPDLAAANVFSNTIAVLLNNGPGTPPCTATLTPLASTGGAIQPSGPVSVPCGSSQTFTIVPDQCHEIADVVVDGESQGALASYTFMNISSNHTIEGRFRAAVHVAAISFDKQQYPAGSNGVLRVTLQNHGPPATVLLTPEIKPRDLDLAPIEPSPVSVVLQSAESRVIEFAWTAPAMTGLLPVDVTVTVDADGCPLASVSVLGRAVVSELTVSQIETAQQQLNACGTTTGRSCDDAPDPKDLLVGLIPIWGTGVTAAKAVQNGCLATDYWQQGRHAQSVAMWMATTANGISAVGDAVDIASCVTGAGCAEIILSAPVDLALDLTSGLAVCVTHLLDLLSFSSTFSTSSASATSDVLTWLPDTLYDSFRVAGDTLDVLAFASGPVTLRVMTGSVSTTSDSLAHSGAVVVPMPTQSMTYALLRTDVALLGRPDSTVGPPVLRIDAHRRDTSAFVLMRRTSSGPVRVTYAPFVLDSGGIAAMTFSPDSIGPALRVDVDGDGSIDYIHYPGGMVVGVLPALLGDGPSRALVQLSRAHPNPTDGGTTFLLRIGLAPFSGRFVIQDISGRLVASQPVLSESPGEHRLYWSGTDTRGQRVRPGVYYASITANGTRSQARAVVLVR